MREFAGGAGRIEALPLLAKVLYTAFVALTLVGLLSSLALYSRAVGFSAHATPHELYQHLIDHYRGSAGDEPARFQRLLEVTHFHLFSMPVILLILGHLTLLTRATQSAKLWLNGTAIAATVIHIAVPWGIYLTGAGVAWLYPISGGLLLVSYAVLGAFPVHQMWRRPPARQNPP
jgi:hypothetical protein